MPNEFIIKNGFQSQGNSEVTGSLIVTAGVTGSFTGSFVGSGAGLTGVSAFPFTGSALITGSLGVTGSASILAFTSSASNIFTIRNSANTLNFAQFNGDGTYFISSAGSTLADSFSRISDGRMFMAKNGANFIELNPAGGNRLYNPAGGWGLSGNTDIATTIEGSNTGTGTFHFYAGNLQIGTGLIASSAASMSIWMTNGTAPAVNAADRHWYYSADANGVNGAASPHFRTEDGSIIKLYQQAAVTSSQGLADALTNLGFLTGSSVIASTSAFPFTGSALITGSLGITGSLSTRAQGALSTDVAFRVRNNADTANLVESRGDGTHFFYNSTGTTNINFYGFGHGIWAIGGSSFRIKNLYGSTSIEGTTLIRFLTDVTSKAVTFDGRQLHIGGQALPSINGDSCIVIENANTIPTASITDRHYYYSADITAGNAAPHFRTENGSIIKLYKEIQPALSASANTGDANTNALIEAMKTIILNLGFGASS